jgi:AraC family transcriptional regulator, transcriptional activator of the genes for pyochelin and ferripyochelin receptors
MHMTGSPAWTLDATQRRVQAPDEGTARLFGQGLHLDCRRISFERGFAVCSIDAHGAQDMAFEAPPDDRPYLYLQTVVAGDCHLYAGDESVALQPGRSTLMRAEGRSTGWLCRRTGPLRVVSIDIPEPMLVEWLGGRLPKVLRAMQAGAACGAQSLTLPALPAWQRVLLSLGDPAVHGGLHGLAAEGAALQVLSHHLQPLAEESEASSATPGENRRDARAAAHARERLLADLRNPPSLQSLAAELGLSPRRLQTLFRRCYGCSPFQLVLNARLDQARDELRDGRLSVKEVAWRAGYRHATSFTHAFRARFGVSPEGMRGR